MATSPPSKRWTAIAIMAKAPIPGYAKSRLIPAIGKQAAAQLQERLTARAVKTAIEANVGPITVWAAPDAGHDTLLTMVVHNPIALKPQPAGDLGKRLHAAVLGAKGPVLVIGTDCPALAPMHLRSAAKALQDGIDVVLMPGESGGFVLIGLRQPAPTLFDDMPWASPRMLTEMRARIMARRLMFSETPPLWDIGTGADLARMEREIPELALAARG